MPLIKPAQGSKLAYPAGRTAGFDPSHPASGKKARFAAVATGNTFRDLIASPLGVISGSPTAAIDGAIGPSYHASGATSGVAFTNSRYNFANPATQTMAAIVRIGRNNFLGWSDTSFAGTYLSFQTDDSLTLYTGVGGNVSSGIFVDTVNTPPYFVASSNGPGGTNFLVKNLKTGQVFTASVAGTSLSAPSGASSIYVGNVSSMDGGPSGNIAAAMFSDAYLSLAQLRQWAVDPWAFWFPNKTLNLTSTAAVGGGGASFLPVWAYGYNLPVLGTGTF